MLSAPRRRRDARLPAALPLFATGLGAFGLLGWRRKKNRQHSLRDTQQQCSRGDRREAVFLFAMPCPLLAQSRHSRVADQCPLSGLKRTLCGMVTMSVERP